MTNVHDDAPPQTVIVTGAAGGIGQVVARTFVERGARVLLADIQREKVEDLARELAVAGGSAVAAHVDVTSTVSAAAMVETALQRFGQIDVLVHCAGLDAPRSDVWELDDDLWDRIIAVDLTSAWKCARAVLAHMAERRTGRIVLISSIASWRGSQATAVAYNAAKAGVNGLTVGLATQLEKHGIMVNAVAPGPTGTGEPMTAAEIATDRGAFPLPIRGAQPVADACVYLAGPGGAWISGTVMNVSGGRWRR